MQNNPALNALGIAFSLLAPMPAAAEIRDLAVVEAKDIGPFDGRAFREISAEMEGEAPGGTYSAPVTLVLPENPASHNGFALVDVVNTVTIGAENFVAGGGPFPLARIHMGDAFLFGQGNAYVSVIWDKAAVEALGNGQIADPEDGYTIIRDAATLARNPGAFLPEDADLDEAVTSDRVIAYGFSQTGSLLRHWFQGRNTAETEPVFDGGLVAGAGGSCMSLADGESTPCEGPAVDGAKVIALVPQTDAEWGGHLERAEHPDYRYIEIAGVSHIPVPAADFRQGGMPEQNPADFGPAFRAALVNLQNWLEGEEPPPSVALELSDEPTGELGIRYAETDADGNALGGLRLPHMLSSGGEAGAPLGRYTGFASDWAEDNIFFALAGTFEPFRAERLQELYPSKQAYIDRVTAAARGLAEQGYILPEDAEAYITAAERETPVQ
jgi:hypothetical protein